MEDDDGKIMENDARFISVHVSSGWYSDHLCTHIKLSTGMNMKKVSSAESAVIIVRG
jgi:hypothetical protein